MLYAILSCLFVTFFSYLFLSEVSGRQTNKEVVVSSLLGVASFLFALLMQS